MDLFEEDTVVQVSEEDWCVVGQQPMLEVKVIGEVDKVNLPVSADPFTAIVHVKAPKDESSTDSKPRAPIDLLTVLDVSGSMSGKKLELLKTAMEFVIQNLRSQDRLSIVSFSTTATVHLGFKRMTSEGRSAAMAVVEKLRAMGGTDICSGLKASFSTFSSRKTKNEVTSIMLLSDGLDNNVESHRWKALPVESYIDHNKAKVPVYTFGFGSDHDLNTMQSIAEATGGSFCYVQKEANVRHAFAQCIGGLLSVVAQHVEVVLEASGEAKIRSAAGIAFDGNGAKAHTMTLGSLFAEEEKDLVVELNLQGSSLSAAPLEILKVGGRFQDPAGRQQRELVNSSLVVSGGEVGEKIKVEVERHMNRVLASKAMSAAGELGLNVDEAKRVLEEAKVKIESSRAFQAEDRLSKRLVTELGDMIQGMNSNRLFFETTGGRAMMRATGNCHENQRAVFALKASTACYAASRLDEDCDEDEDMGFALYESEYATEAMVNMVGKSRNFESQRDN